MSESPPILHIEELTVRFGTRAIFDGLSLDVARGEVLGFIGASGSGKSVLMRTILGLIPKTSGTLHAFDQDLDTLNTKDRFSLERRWGVLFQQGALFSGLTVKENIQVPMRAHMELSQALMDELAYLKLTLVGLKPEAMDQYPSELSGGMIKRAALARALALDPELLFLDEPTAGLDPIGAGEFDDLIKTLQETLNLTVFMVTHDLDTLYTICTKIAALGGGKILAQGTIQDLEKNQDPWLQQYFHGNRARAVQKAG
jgi:phospholipid/cholesterol/gamma-HCH transport system ATP-binding protein